MIVNIILGIIGLGIVIIIHETGHFLAAKAAGISVEAFSIGWGKALFSWQRKGTEYRIGILPIGGYCRMKGGDQLQKAIEEKRTSMPHEEGSFFSAAPLKRIFVSVSGPAFNLIFAFIIFSLIWSVGFSVKSFQNRIVLVSDYSSESRTFAADRAGLKTGDRIIEIDGKKIENYNDIKEAVAPAAEKPLSVLVNRDGVIRKFLLTPEKDPDSGVGLLGIYAWIDPVVGEVTPDSPAAIAGLQRNDRIISIEGERINHTIDLITKLAKRPEQLGISYERNGASYSASLLISYEDDGEPNLGIFFEPLVYKSERVNLPTALGKGTEETYSVLKMTVKSIGLLFSGINIREAVSGPIRLTYYVGAIASEGFKDGLKDGLSTMFRFLSLLSVFFFFMNLLPIPALDGGHIVLQLIEGITRRTPKPAIIYRYQIIGFTIIVGILIFSTFNDVSFFISR